MKKVITLLTVLLIIIEVSAQNEQKTRLRLSAPLIDMPENLDHPHNYPSMYQALNFSNDFYELGYWGVDELGNALFKDATGEKFRNKAFKYIIGLGFAKFGSELPIPLGVWAHEEYHRAVLGLNDISAKNGNWLFTRWDGTVFGVSDSAMSHLKSTEPEQLLYAYTSGIQYEVHLNQYISVRDFFDERTHYKNALLLYNAWYIYDYFNFSVSDKSDSVKMIAPENEDRNPMQRDFAGADLTAWIYDMFSPETPFSVRDNFPGGEGVNRRIGFADLTADGQDYLKKQRTLSLLNFLNPAIFFINRIKINDYFSFNFFTQYAPTHFGNDLALYIPFKLNDTRLLLNLHRYSNYKEAGFGIGAGYFDIPLTSRLKSDIEMTFWNQPKNFLDNNKVTGGYLHLESSYALNNSFEVFLGLDAKTKGWMIGEPKLHKGYSITAGLHFRR